MRLQPLRHLKRIPRLRARIPLRLRLRGMTNRRLRPRMLAPRNTDHGTRGTRVKSAEETSAARTQLAAMMLREDPAAFREMVFAGLRALEEAEKGSGISANASNLPRLAQVYAANRRDAQSAIGATLGSPTSNVAG